MRLVLASHNAGKLRELREILAPRGWETQPIAACDTAEVAETAPTFVENALLKARHASRVSGLPAIADDSGLEVDALDGALGVRSARYAGRHGDDAANNMKLLAALRGVPAAQRTARFVCAMVYLRRPDDPMPLIALGTWEGRILDTPCGTDGFGYDPVFFVPAAGCSAAELGAARKNALSHRGQALRALCAALAARCGV